MFSTLLTHTGLYRPILRLHIIVSLILALSLPVTSFGATLLDIYRSALSQSARWQSIDAELKSQQTIANTTQAAFRPTIGVFANQSLNWLSSQSAQLPELSNDTLTRLNSCLSATNDYNQCLNSIAQFQCDDDPGCLLGRSGANQSTSQLQYGISFDQPIYNASKWAQAQQGQPKLSLARWQARAKRLDFLQELIQTYLQTLHLQQELAQQRADYRRNQQQLRQVERSFEADLVGASEVLAARGAVQMQAAAINQLKLDQSQALVQLSAFTGASINKLAGLDPSLPMPPPEPSNAAAWQSMSRNHNPELQMLRAQMRLAELTVNDRQGQRKPSLALSARYVQSQADQQSLLLQTGDNSIGSLGLRLSLPLYAGGALKKGVEGAQQQWDQLRLEKLALEAQLDRDIGIAFDAATGTLSQTELLYTALTSLKEQVRLVERGFETGVVKAQDVLDARQRLLETQVRYAQTRFNYISQSLTLKRLAGVLSETDIAVINSWSDQAGDMPTSRKTLFDDARSWLDYDANSTQVLPLPQTLPAAAER